MAVINVDTPSIIVRIIPPSIACLKAYEAPPLIANTPPVINPDTTALNLSSTCLEWINKHSTELKIPPQRAKLPPRKGARFLM